MDMFMLFELSIDKQKSCSELIASFCRLNHVILISSNLVMGWRNKTNLIRTKYWKARVARSCLLHLLAESRILYLVQSNRWRNIIHSIRTRCWNSNVAQSCLLHLQVESGILYLVQFNSGIKKYTLSSSN